MELDDFNGKWILKEAGYKLFKSLPGLIILVISDHRAKLYDNLNLRDAKVLFTILEGAFFQKNNRKFADFKLTDINSLILLGDGLLDEGGKEAIEITVQYDYARLNGRVCRLYN